MSQERAGRVRRILAGVLVQAVADARVAQVNVVGTGAHADFIRDLCVTALGADSIGRDGLLVHPENKTALLLGHVPAADILLLGDLYYSQVVELAGPDSLPGELAELATECGGADRLDGALALLFDRRANWDATVVDLPAHVREKLKRMLDAARFKRTRVGLVPKLGMRTLGIDLYA